MKKIFLFLILATPVMGMSVKEAEKILQEHPILGDWRVETQTEDLIKLTAKPIDPFNPFLQLSCVLKKDENKLITMFYLQDPNGVIETIDTLGYIRILIPGHDGEDVFRNTWLYPILPKIYNLNCILQPTKTKSDLEIRPFGDFLLKKGGAFAISPVPGVPKGKHVFMPSTRNIYAAAVVLMGGISKADFYKSLEMPDFSETEFKLVPYK